MRLVGLPYALHGITRFSRATVAAEGSRELRGEKIDLASDGIGALEIRPVDCFLELDSKVREASAILAPRAVVDDVAQVGIAAHPLVRKTPFTHSSPTSSDQRWSVSAASCRREPSLRMEQQMLEVDETLQAADGDPGALVSDAPEVSFVEDPPSEEALHLSSGAPPDGIRSPSSRKASRRANTGLFVSQ